MCPRGNDRLRGNCKKIELNKDDQKNVYLSCPQNSGISQLSTISLMPKSSLENFVYKRRKLRANSNPCASGKGGESSRSDGCFTLVSCNTRLVATKEKHVAVLSEHEIGGVRLQSLSPVSKSNIPNGSLGSEALVKKTLKGIFFEVDSVNDCCSSSKLNVDQVLSSTKAELDELSACSSSSTVDMKYIGEDLSEKEFCISILRSHGLLSSDCSTRSFESSQDNSINRGGYSRSCKICSRSESTSKLLICDNCEEAFHMRCCKPRIKKVPADEWFCQSCMKKKCIMLKDKAARKLSSIGLILGRNGPSKTSVRIGKSFQAEVPDWLGPTENDDGIGEPIEMDPSEFLTFHEFDPNRTPELGSLNNWLQCQAVLDVSEDDLKNETICGKWRRAPLFDVQTDNWECFCSVLWDPHFADCAVPQEIATHEVLRQVKCIEKLRPQLLANWDNQRDTKGNDYAGKSNVHPP